MITKLKGKTYAMLNLRQRGKTISKEILFGYFLMLIFYSCSERIEFTSELIPLYYNSGREGVDTLIKSYPYYDTLLYKEGEFKLYYSTGELKEKSTWIENCLTNECIIYYKNGNIREYRFYNINGVLCYYRQYNEDGTLKKSVGQPFIQGIVSEYELKVGDKSVTQIYIASPPNCVHSVYGIDDNGRYDIKWRHPQPYIYETSIKFSSEGEYGFPFEIEFEDTIAGSKKIYSEEGFSYSVAK